MPSAPTEPSCSARPHGISVPIGATGELPEWVTRPVSEIDAFLRTYVSGLDLPRGLIDAILYSLLGPGKRARPLLVWHSYVAIAGSPPQDPAAGLLPAAGAVELVHAFSLVHDDLPGIDNDELRRGRPTLHKRTNEAMAILAGDAMLTLAFQLLTERLPSPLGACLTSELSVGTNAMIAGQVYDTLGGFAPGLTDLQRLQAIHERKTGALIRASCRMGALCAIHAAAPRSSDVQAMLTDPRLDSISAYADAMGLMFQVVDDLLDVTQTTEHLGKKAGKDSDAGKLTYPGVIGVEASRREVRELHERAMTALKNLGPGAAALEQLASSLAVRTR